MPVYEYRCADCGAITTVFTRSLTFDRAVACERCAGTNTERAISSFALVRSGEPAGGEDGDTGEPGGMGGFDDDMDFDDF